MCIVPGSDTGIGKKTARELARRGGAVTLAVRDAAKGEAARADLAAAAAALDEAAPERLWELSETMTAGKLSA